MLIDPLSVRSLKLELLANGLSLGTATGFIITESEVPYLITNWHVLVGRNPDTNKLMSHTGALPDTVRITHHGLTLGTFVFREEKLFDTEGKRLWKEHPLGQKIDVVALPLNPIDQGVQLYPFELSLANADIIAQPAMPVSIIGFPLGLTSSGSLPIWKTGHIASDPDLDYGGNPAFLIDATTRGGMSGSPVVLRSNGGHPTRSGSMIFNGQMTTLFLGIYSGRIHQDIEIGSVWKPNVISEIIHLGN